MGAVLLAEDVVVILAQGFGREAVSGVAWLLDFAIMLIVGANGNEWRRRDLEKQGYEHIGWVKAETPEAALKAFEDKELGQVTD